MILEMAIEAQTVVLAYGQPPKAHRQCGEEVVTLLSDHPRLCHLRLAKDGAPVHPLYLPETLTPSTVLREAMMQELLTGRTRLI